MVFTVGQESQIFKAKNGQLTVVRLHLRLWECDSHSLMLSPCRTQLSPSKGPVVQVQQEDSVPFTEQRSMT